MSRIFTLLAALFVIFLAYLMLSNRNPDPEISPIVVPPAPQKNQTATNAASSFHEWREFSSNSSHFKALLPNLPQHVTDTVTDPKTQEPRKYETFAAAADHGSAFMINAITFSNPTGAEASEESLKAAVTDMLARNKENKLNQMKIGNFHGTRALDFSLSNGDILIEGKVFAHKNIMYILSMINKKDSFDRKEFDFFINSFDFFDEGKQTEKNGQEPLQNFDLPTKNPSSTKQPV